jgi:hypothetical protein
MGATRYDTENVRVELLADPEEFSRHMKEHEHGAK